MNVLNRIRESRQEGKQEIGKDRRNGESAVMEAISQPQVVDAKGTYVVTDHLSRSVTIPTIEPLTPQTTKNEPYQGPLPGGPCPVCGSTKFWTCVYDKIEKIYRCFACKKTSPPTASLISETIDIDTGGKYRTREPELDHSPEHIATHYPPWANDWRRPGIKFAPRASQPLCPHCGATIATAADFRKHELKPRRPGWARGDCTRCGKTIWPLINWLPGEEKPEG